jgi:diguanylate cyclase (GGDEF)-like protein
MNKILVIDNEYDIAELIGEILTVNGFKAQTALNGKEGINAAINFHPDLILCDISMPQITGYDVLDSLRKNKETHAIPFIFLTAKDGMQDLRKGMLLGADDYLTKPVSAEELVATVRTRLEKHHQMTSHYEAEIEQTKYHLEITRNYDELTGLPKRSVLEKKLRGILSYKNPAIIAALFIVKFNRFKNIADIFGIQEYFRLIQALVKRIENATREKKNVYCLDDDEFGVLLTHVPVKKNLTLLAKKILSMIRKPVFLENHELNCSACIGMATTNNGSPPPNSLITNAELALDASLGNGFNTFKMYAEDLKKHATDRINIENALHKALDRHEFTLFYQPKIDSRDHTIIGSEALIRWENTDYGLLSPAQFIPIAEENGLIIPIGEWTLESICNQLNIWKNEGLNPPPIAVNISARQLEQKNFLNTIVTTLEKSKVENELLEIELTESILIKNSKRNSKKLSKLRDKGMKVAIDDFGTGYSSLAYLSTFPFDKLKIDQSFIRDITSDRTAASLVTSIISMAHSIGVRVIAEGVETEAQMKFLTNYHCDEIQGYYFSRPIPASNFTELMRKQKM